jgi:hypothetical protein
LNQIGISSLTEHQFKILCEALQRCESLTEIVITDFRINEARNKILQEISAQHRTSHTAEHSIEVKAENVSLAQKYTARQLDAEWEIYCDKSRGKNKRLEARNALIDLLDLHLFKLLDSQDVYLDEPTKLDFLLNDLMSLRQQQKVKGNNDYIPILNSGSYGLLKHASVLKPIPLGQKPDEAKVQQDLDDQRLLDVTDARKKDDLEHPGLKKLTTAERETYNIQIRQGLFYQSKHLCSTTSCFSHHKMGYASFTLNSNGELSIFEHEGTRSSNLHHSSMNAGAPVLAAGEISIENGNHKSLSSYSGHYQPTLFSVYRFLEYLSSRGVDISETTVLLEQKPNVLTTGLKSTEMVIHNRLIRDKMRGVVFAPQSEYDRPIIIHQVPATQIVCNNKAIMIEHIQLVHQFLQNNSEAQMSESDQALFELAKNFRDEMIQIATYLKAASTYSELQFFLDSQTSMIDKYQKKIMAIENSTIKPTAEKTQHLNLLFHNMTKDYEKIDKKSEHTTLGEEKRINAFKKNY